MYVASVILLQTLCQGQLHAMQGFILWISVLWISRNFISFPSQSEKSIIDYLTKSAHFILFRMGQSSEILTVFFY